VQIPVTPAQSRAYVPKVIELARRCGRVSGTLLDNISSEDNARDLNRLRQLVGDRALTYVGVSYGSVIGETYANLFPNRVRAMMLDCVVDPILWTKSAEARVADHISPTLPAFAQFLKLCQAAGPARCALARHAPLTAAQRVARLFRRARRAPIPAPRANPAGVLTHSDLLLTTFQPMRSPLDWLQYARELDAAASGNASALETAARQFRMPANLSESTTSAAIQCADGPARRPLSAWPAVMGHLTRVGPLWAPFLGWTNWAPCAANWPGHPTERYAGPWNAKTKHPILLINNVFDPADSYTRAQHVERLLGNAVLLTVHSWGHPSYALPSKCVDWWRVRYLVHLITPPRGAVRQTQRPFR